MNCCCTDDFFEAKPTYISAGPGLRVNTSKPKQKNKPIRQHLRVQMCAFTGFSWNRIKVAAMTCEVWDTQDTTAQALSHNVEAMLFFVFFHISLPFTGASQFCFNLDHKEISPHYFKAFTSPFSSCYKHRVCSFFKPSQLLFIYTFSLFVFFHQLWK